MSFNLLWLHKKFGGTSKEKLLNLQQKLAVLITESVNCGGKVKLVLGT